MGRFKGSLFAELIVKFGEMTNNWGMTNNEEYIQRRLAALHGLFIMMFTPLNPEAEKQWKLEWNSFK